MQCMAHLPCCVACCRRELVTGFEGGRLQSADPSAPVQCGKRVIPKQEDTFQVGVGPKKYNPNRCRSPNCMRRGQ